MWLRDQRNKVMKYGGGAPESPLSIGPELLRYATVPSLSVISFFLGTVDGAVSQNIFFCCTYL